jgi:hypothetical protein
MDKILIAAVLACRSGHRLVNWSDRIPPGIQPADVVVTVEPFYTRLLICRPGHPDTMQRCCNGKQASVVRIEIEDSRFCIGQSQMKWSLRLMFKPGISLSE